MTTSLIQFTVNKNKMEGNKEIWKKLINIRDEKLICLRKKQIHESRFLSYSNSSIPLFEIHKSIEKTNPFF